jgi:hypothetical protein
VNSTSRHGEIATHQRGDMDQANVPDEEAS